jgi:hypothetical protein
MGVAKPARPMPRHPLTTHTRPVTPQGPTLSKRPPRRMGVANPARPMPRHPLTINPRPFTPTDRRFPSAHTPSG